MFFLDIHVQKMTELKREYVVPLRRKSLTAPKWRRSKKAIVVLKDYMRKHMKCEDIIVCSELNEHIWARGSKNPPGKVEVIALKTQLGNDEKVLVNLKSAGVDSQKELYNTAVAPVAQEAPAKDAVVDTEVKEAESSESLEEALETKEEVKETKVEKKTEKKVEKKTVKSKEDKK